MIFQSTHPSGVRPQRLWERALIAYFNPRTPVGCDVVGCHLAVVHGDISIHAPQWGATQHHHHLGAGDQISIHAPQWGATQKSHSIRRNRHHFNPRTPVGCDKPMVDQITEMYEFQSTHPSGVRPALCFHPSGAMDFNPRTPVGCDPTGLKISHRDTDFNPRTPVGCDTIPRVRRAENGISIHAPQWGATQRDSKSATVIPISIHAPQWGATRSRVSGVPKMAFQSTHPSGVRRCLGLHDSRGCLISIHAPQWGATRSRVAMPGLLAYFNPRTPVGCDSASRPPPA